MKKTFSILLIVALLFSNFPPQFFGGIFSATNSKANSDVPYFDGKTHLLINGLIGNEIEYRRVDSKGLAGVQYLGEFRYATIYDGKLSGSPSSDNTTFNVNGKSTRAYAGDKWYHIVPKSLGTARNLIRVSDLTSNEFVNRYGGSVENYAKLTKFYVDDSNLKTYGEFYYIGDVVKKAGGFAENTGANFDSTNPTRLRILKTAKPDITNFSVSATNTEVGKPVTFDLTAFEYNYGGNNLNYEFIITDESGKEVGRKVKSVTSTKNASGGNATQDRSHTGKYDEKTFFTFTPATAGKFTATLKVTDGVLRSSAALTKTVTVKEKGQPYLEVTPETITIKKGEKASYKAFFTDKTGKRTDVTDKAIWKAIKTNIAATSGKGIFTGLEDGTTPVEAAYTGFKDDAELIVSSDPAPPPEEEEEEIPNEPPTVELIVPETVTVGDKFCAVANAHDSDGTIESYGWDYSGRGDIQGKRQACDLYYEEEGEKTVTVVVTDDNGDSAEDTKKIIVTKPMPTAYFYATGTHKENRKISLKAVHPYSDNNVALNKYPLVKETWTIQTTDPSKQDKLRIVQDISGNVPYTQQIDFLLKETGEVNVTRYVENSIGESATYTTTLNVIKDEVPVADFDVLETVYRDPQDDNTAKATIELKDNSYSTDDIIQKRVWRIAYDSNNDGNFSDESFVVIDEDNNESPKYTTSKVGKYLIELEVFEKYIHETIPEFVDLTFNKATTDLRNANTDKKAIATKIVEVDNLAPVTSIGLKDSKKTVEVQYDAVDSPYSEAQLNAMTPYLNNLLGEHDLKANITFSTNATYEHQVFASGWDKNYILTGDGKVYGMGGGIIGNGSATGVLDARGNIIAPYVEIPLPGRVRQVTATNRTATHFLLENGDVYGVGGNSIPMTSRYDKNGKLTVFPNTQVNVGTIGDGTTTPRYSPVKINLPAKVVKMESTPTTTLFLLETGEIYGVGNIHESYSSNVYNSLIIFDKAGLKVPSDVPRNLKLPVKVKDFAMGSAKDGSFVIGYMIVIDENGVAYGLGDGRSWGTSDRYPIWEKLPQRLQDIKKATKLINQADMGYGGSTDYINLYLKKDGSVIRAMRTGLYSDDPITRFSLPKIKDITSSYRGYSHIFLSEDNDLYAVGHNQYGTLGFPIGSTFPWGKYDWITDVIESPAKVNLSFKVKQVSLGNDNMSILADNGNIYVVGRNINTNLGVNTKEDLTLLTRVGDFNIKFSKKAVFKQQPSPMYMTTFANKPLNVDDIQSKINNTNGYYVGITTEGNRGAVNTVVNNNSGKGTFIDIGATYNDANLRAKIQELANYIIATENNNAVEVEVLLDESIGISPATIESKINSIVKAKVAGNSSVPFASRVRVLTGAYKFDEVSLDSKNKFVVAIKNNSYSAEQENQITATNLINNAHFLGVGTGINKGTIDRMVAKSLKKGTYIDNANIDSSLNAVADYILSEIEANRGMTEVFITTEESVDYTTNYSDYENDPLFDSFWKFNHELSYFESETGYMAENNSKVKMPTKKFGLTGRYQVHYAAQDDPLTRYFATSSISNFTDYRKWSNEANNLKIYVHKKPSADFTFTLDQMTGAYTITNLAKDDDKASINVGFGAGLQSQRFDYRINGGEWIDGLPDSPLEPNTKYEVRNTVIDLQNKSENVIKVLSRINLPPVADFETDKSIYEANENIRITNKSYDPNNDDLSGVWSYKLKDETDAAYKSLGTGSFTKNNPGGQWHTSMQNVQCDVPNANGICEYVVKLKVTDQYGLSDEVTKIVEVRSVEVIEIGVKSVEIFTAPANKGLPVFLEINENLLVPNTNNTSIEQARETLVQIDVYRDNQLHMTHNTKVKNLIAGHSFNISPTNLKVDTEYEFEFRLKPLDESVILVDGADKISLKPRTAAEKTITNTENEFIYKGLVSVSRQLNKNQVNSFEKITVNTDVLEPSVTGFGKSLDQSYVYELPENRQYKAANMFDISSKVSFDKVLIDTYFEDTESNADRVAVNTVLLNQSNSTHNQSEIIKETLGYPKVFVDKKTGDIFSENQKLSNDSRITSELIDGGNKLYIPIWLERLGEYEIEYVSNSVGVNKVKFVTTQMLNIEAYLYLHINSETKNKDKFLIEPVNKKIPFPEGKPANWTNTDVEWIRN